MNIQNLTQHLKATACQTHQVNPEDQPSVNAQPKVAACWGNVRINRDFKPSTNPYAIPVQEPDRQGYQDRQKSQNTVQNPPALQSTNTAPTFAANGISHPRFTPIDGLPNQHNAPSGQIPSVPSTQSDQTIPPRSTLHTQSAIPVHSHSPPHVTVPHTVNIPSPIPPGTHYQDNQSNSVHGLPPINHDAAITRVKIQYTGIGDMFVFSNQLLNALEQFGVFLIPLNNVEYNTSLCPTTYQSYIVTAQHYDSMLKALYQKLQSPDIIPMEHTSICNVINRFAEINDGYQVLYAMLELVHPALHEDAVLLPPKSADCQDDIHLYAHKFDSWLRYETYANCLYSTREQVNCFIRELSPTFAPAVSRIRCLLDTWQPYDTNTPNALQLKQLPNTIECYMMEETGNNIWVRCIRDKHRNSPHENRDRRDGRDGKDKDKCKTSRDSRSLQDVYCSLCGGHGHPDTQCDFSAKLLKTQESLKAIDQKRKMQLQANLSNKNDGPDIFGRRSVQLDNSLVETLVYKKLMNYWRHSQS